MGSQDPIAILYTIYVYIVITNFSHLQFTGSTPLMLAIEYGHVQVAKTLLSCNVNLDATNKVKNFIHESVVTSCTQFYNLKF